MSIAGDHYGTTCITIGIAYTGSWWMVRYM